MCMHEDYHCGSAAGGLHCGATRVDQSAKSCQSSPSFAACGHNTSLLLLSALCQICSWLTLHHSHHREFTIFYWDSMSCYQNCQQSGRLHLGSDRVLTCYLGYMGLVLWYFLLGQLVM